VKGKYLLNRNHYLIAGVIPQALKANFPFTKEKFLGRYLYYFSQPQPRWLNFGSNTP